MVYNINCQGNQHYIKERKREINIKRFTAFITLLFVTATWFIPLAKAAEVEPVAHFTSEAHLEGGLLAVDIYLAEMSGEVYASVLDLGYDNELLEYDHYEVGEIELELHILEHNAEDGMLRIRQTSSNALSGTGLFLTYYFKFDEAVANKTVEFNLTVYEVVINQNVVATATAEGCTFTFSTSVRFTSEAYIENDMLVVDLNIEELSWDIAACKIQLSYDNLIIAFDRYEHGEAFSGESSYMVSQEWGDIQITHEMTDDSAPISEAGRFLRFYFNYYEAVVIGSTVKFRFDVLYATNSIGAEIDAKAEGTSYTFEANYGEKTVFTSKAYFEDDYIAVQINLDQLMLTEGYSISECVVTLTYDEALTYHHFKEMGAFIGNDNIEHGEDNSLSITQNRETGTAYNLTGRFLKVYFSYNKEEIFGKTLEFGLSAYELADDIKLYADAYGCELIVPSLGDVNFDAQVNTGDAVSLLRHIAGNEILDNLQLMFADVNKDGKVNTGDATRILIMTVQG
ncbi:MAG TPA: hypothetical protein GXZ61_06230 [Clostridiales bacterium]|nr:hypothetical protein [Clostridiales bacterium]